MKAFIMIAVLFFSGSVFSADSKATARSTASGPSVSAEELVKKIPSVAKVCAFATNEGIGGLHCDGKEIFKGTAFIPESVPRDRIAYLSYVIGLFEANGFKMRAMTDTSEVRAPFFHVVVGR